MAFLSVSLLALKTREEVDQLLVNLQPLPSSPGTAHLSEPSLHPSPDNYPIQPLARRPGPADVPSPLPTTTHIPLTPAVTSHGGPHPPVAAQMGGGGGGGGGNPYRMGTAGGARKLTYTSAPSAFSGGSYPPMGPPPQLISQPMMGPVPTSQVAPPLSQPTMPATQVGRVS